MTKCNFCPKSYPKGNCFWSFRTSSEEDCEKAIKRMTEVLHEKEEKKCTKCKYHIQCGFGLLSGYKCIGGE